MGRYGRCRIFVLCCLCSYAIAAPPINLPSAQTLEFSSQNITLPSTVNVTAPTRASSGDSLDLPPYPPSESFSYNCGANIVIEFMRYRYEPNRNEAKVQSAYLKAVNDVLRVSTRDKTLPMGSGEYVWATGDARLVGESIYRQGGDVRLTWNQFGVVLMGVGEYGKAYPGLYFAYKIYLSDHGVRYQVGRGALTVRKDPTKPPL